MACVWFVIATEWMESQADASDDTTAQYVTCYYASLLMIAGGDVAPMTYPEKLWASAALFSGSVIVAIVFGNVAVLVQNMSASSMSFRQKMQRLFHHMTNIKMPNVLRSRVEFYYRTFWSHYNSIDGKIASFVPELSRNLSDEVMLFLKTKLILGSPLFKSCSSTVVYVERLLLLLLVLLPLRAALLLRPPRLRSPGRATTTPTLLLLHCYCYYY